MSPFSDLYVKNGEACVDDSLDRAGLGGPVTLLPLLHPPHHCMHALVWDALLLELCLLVLCSPLLLLSNLLKN